ncbi:MAG: hypothetical protein AAFQ91_31225 [Cyanobacteria bacterium J06621_15]
MIYVDIPYKLAIVKATSQVIYLSIELGKYINFYQLLSTFAENISTFAYWHFHISFAILYEEFIWYR